MIAGPRGWSGGWLRKAVALKIVGEIVGPLAYDVEGYQLCVACVNEDNYVLCPAGCC